MRCASIRRGAWARDMSEMNVGDNKEQMTTTGDQMSVLQ